MCARVCLTRCNCGTACVRLGTGITRSCKAGEAEAASASGASRRQEGRGRGCCSLDALNAALLAAEPADDKPIPDGDVSSDAPETASTGGSMAGQRNQLPARGSPRSAARKTPAVLRAIDTSINGGRSQFGGVQSLRRGGHRAMHGAQRRARAVRILCRLLRREDTDHFLLLRLRDRPCSPVAVWVLPCHVCEGRTCGCTAPAKARLVRLPRSTSHLLPP